MDGYPPSAALTRGRVLVALQQQALRRHRRQPLQQLGALAGLAAVDDVRETAWEAVCMCVCVCVWGI